MSGLTCYHCGDPVRDEIRYDEKSFCCKGCKTVYEIFSTNDLTSYYEMQAAPGASPKMADGKFDYLSNELIVEKLLEFRDEKTGIVSLYIPHIHCSSCIWILENLHKLQPGINSSQVDFPKKTVRITFDTEKTSLKELVEFLNLIGYEPYISLEDSESGKIHINRSIIYKLGVSGFAFGNVMFLSFPEYFEVSEFWLDQYKGLFRWLMFAFSLPVVFYVARDYFISAYKGMRAKILNIDVPLALGIVVLFVRSTLEIIFDWGTGFFDSLTGLIFFLTLGKFFQQKTYNFLSFE
ncbi:MAG TPA: heavy metal translocating P-type ATPase metal-binding domain-containing protein, partial [Gillisia sp.]|nr:heavy metal translocating P-type ATPase metal-binding domain-containing protein [Gillisia sp.]